MPDNTTNKEEFRKNPAYKNVNSSSTSSSTSTQTDNLVNNIFIDFFSKLIN